MHLSIFRLSAWVTGPALDFNQQVGAPLPGAQTKKPLDCSSGFEFFRRL
jgi:hypothetical protein